jgi:hypothetical protein
MCINEFHFPIPWHVDEVRRAGLNYVVDLVILNAVIISGWRSCSLFL